MFPGLSKEGVKPHPHCGRCHPVGSAILWAVPSLGLPYWNKWKRKQKSTSALLSLLPDSSCNRPTSHSCCRSVPLQRCPTALMSTMLLGTLRLWASFLKWLLSVTLSQQHEMWLAYSLFFFLIAHFLDARIKSKTHLIAPKSHKQWQMEPEFVSI